MDPLSKFKDYIERINSILIKEFEEFDPKLLSEPSLYIIEAGGKRVRPIFAILACKALGGDVRNILYPAAGLELIHTFSLVHDDIIDKDTLRRGKATIHAKWGEEVGILVGDFLFAKAFELCSKSNNYRFSEELARAATDLCIGQIYDLMYENKNITEKQYIEMVKKKTASLFKCACRIGAIAAEAESDKISLFGKFGEYAGIAFQIIDDVIDLTSSEEKLGKPKGSDIREGKRTIIVIKALNVCNEDERRYLLKVLGKEEASKNEIEKVIRILDRCGAIDYAKQKAYEYLEKAKSFIEKVNVKDNDAKNDLIELAEFFVKREY